MAHRLRDELHATTDEPRVRSDQESVNALQRKARVARVDVGVAARGKNFDLLPNGRAAAAGR